MEIQLCCQIPNDSFCSNKSIKIILKLAPIFHFANKFCCSKFSDSKIAILYFNDNSLLIQISSNMLNMDPNPNPNPLEEIATDSVDSLHMRIFRLLFYYAKRSCLNKKIEQLINNIINWVNPFLFLEKQTFKKLGSKSRSVYDLGSLEFLACNFNFLYT